MWAARGTNAWLLGLSKNCYHCNLFYVPQTRAYHISGSAELFPQHCQVPNLRPIEHLEALTAELTDETTAAASTTKGKALLHIIRTHLDTLMSPPLNPAEQPLIEQKVRTDMQPVTCGTSKGVNKPANNARKGPRRKNKTWS